MPTLDFKGKNYVYAHHLSVPFRSLNIVPEKSLPKDGKPNMGDNLIIQGDNLHALKALLPQYAGKVKCIYIDPPYNTGEEGWCYNDNVNSPLMKEWLKENANPVDRRIDMEAHDKWLCMMWPRLQLLHELLADDGVIFIHINDIENHSLRHVMNETFNENNFLCEMIWRSGGTSSEHFTVEHEYILSYAKNKKRLPYFIFAEDEVIIDRAIKKISQKNPASEITFPVGIRFEGEDKEFSDEIGGAEKTYITKGRLKCKNGLLAEEVTIKAGWAMADQIKTFLRGEKVFDSKGQRIIEFFFKANGVLNYAKQKETFHPNSILANATTKNGSSEINQIFGKKIFDYPKPSKLSKYLLGLTARGEDIVLDSFAGSGTTAHAVLDLNKEDGGNRKFILVEMEDYANDITAERVRRVIKGVPDAKDDSLKEGLGGSFTYCELGKPFDIEDMLNGDNLPDYESLAKYVFYTATGHSLDDAVKPAQDYFIGETDLFEVYLIYKDDLAYLRSNESALNQEKLDVIAGRKGTKQKIVFATAKYMSQSALNEHKVTFCQIPYAIHKIAGN